VAARLERSGGFRSAPHARELRAWAEADLQAIADAVAPAWRGWLADWSAAADPAEGCVTVARAHEVEAASREWRAFGTRNAGAAWLAGGDEQVQRLVHWLLFGELHASANIPGATVARQVRGAACGELLARLRAALGIASCATQGPAGDHLWHRWAGAAELLFDCEDAELHILLDAACVEAILGRESARPRRRGGLASVPHALRSQRVVLRAILEPLELTLGSLSQLRPGDILPLSHSLDADIALADAGDARIMGGFLGRAGGLRALQLAPGAPSSRELAS
jgi:hypothetical protein